MTERITNAFYKYAEENFNWRETKMASITLKGDWAGAGASVPRTWEDEKALADIHKAYGTTPSQTGASANSACSQAAPTVEQFEMAPQRNVVGAEPKAAAPMLPAAPIAPSGEWAHWHYMAQRNQAPWMAQQYPAPWQPMAPMWQGQGPMYPQNYHGQQAGKGKNN